MKLRLPRPLTRDSQSQRDDRLFIVACDDTYAPRQYFNFFRLSRLQIHVVATTDGTSAAQSVLRRLKEFDYKPYDERWMLLDTDRTIQDRHLPSFTAALSEARQCGVKVALSKPCFELWLRLHHVDESEVGELRTCKHVEQKLRQRLGEYNKTKLKAEHYPPESRETAYMRAERLDSTVEGGDIPAGTTTRVHQLWKAITPLGPNPQKFPARE